ncbi:hypothetical protein [Cryptosporangium sp. NPDC048952]|uniref:hypothetical protein n=1 Tax=Cryptosporangium sp. NPDC048952 TaxID=3363961 RepID=UPI00371F33B3
MRKRSTRVRAQALRRAQEAGSARHAQRRVRELEVENALAVYFECAGDAERIRRQAEARAARILADAEQAAADSKGLSVVALHQLFWLGETRASIVKLTGLSVAEVRTALAGVRRAEPRARAVLGAADAEQETDEEMPGGVTRVRSGGDDEEPVGAESRRHDGEGGGVR